MAYNRNTKKKDDRKRTYRVRRKRRVCFFCEHKKDSIDFLDTAFVQRFITDRGKIMPRRTSGACSLHQRKVAKAVKKAREVGLVPYTIE